MNVTEIKQAIKKLSKHDLSHFRAWFDEICAELWDKQIERDAKSGRLDQLLAKATEEHNAGLSKPL